MSKVEPHVGDILRDPKDGEELTIIGIAEDGKVAIKCTKATNFYTLGECDVSDDIYGWCNKAGENTQFWDYIPQKENRIKKLLDAVDRL